MKRPLPILLLVWISMGGCATHYYEIDGRQVSVYLKKPDAGRMHFACSLDDYEPHEARQVGGRWVVTVPADTAFRYFYIVDGSAFTPPCRLKEKDDFGSENCIFQPGM